MNKNYYIKSIARAVERIGDFPEEYVYDIIKEHSNELTGDFDEDLEKAYDWLGY